MKECFDNAAPQRETFDEHTLGEKKNTDLFDNTAVIGLQTFANRMQKAIVPAWQEWGTLVPGDEIDDPNILTEFNGKEIPLAEALEHVTRTVFTYIHRSNFSSRVYEAFIDLGISTGTITCEYDPKRDRLVFNAVPLSQLYLQPGPDGEIDDHWREHMIECGQLLQLWPDAKNIPPAVARKMKSNPGEKIGVIEGCIYENGEYYYVVLLSKQKTLIYTQDENEIGPFISFRGMVVPGEAYGRGPIMQVLPAIKTLNVVKEYELTAAAIAASGAWTGRSDGVFNPYTIEIIPGVVIPVASNDRSNPTVAALPMNFDVNFTQIVASDIRDEINKALFAEPLGSTDDPTKTATEINVRYQMHLESSGAYFARLQTELVEKTVKRVVHVLQKDGKIPPIKVDGKEITLKHTSPISRVMDQEDLQNLQQAVAEVSIFGEELPMLTFDVEKCGEFIAEKRGVSPSLYRDENQRKTFKEEVGDAMNTEQGQEAAGELG